MTDLRFAGGMIGLAMLAMGMAGCGSASEYGKAIPKSDECVSISSDTGACSVAFFGASKDSVDTELWRSDGTAEGTYQVQDINPTGPSYPSAFTWFNGKAYFSADDGVNGTELWVTDGTPEGTAMVKDIHPTGSADPAELVVFNDRLYFVATNDTGRYLWLTDGTAGGTFRVLGSPAYVDPYSLTVMGSALYFGAAAADGGDTELWMFDGLGLASVVQDIYAAGSSYPSQFAVVGGALYFSATDSDVGTELRMWDGTSVAVAVNACATDTISACDGSPDAVYGVGSQVFFAAETDGGAASELWVHNGTSGTLVKDIFPGDKALVSPVGGVSGKFVFTAVSSAGWQLWTSDGTGLGTEPLTTFGSTPDVRTAGTLGGQLYALVNVGSSLQIWRTDGSTAGTVRVYQSLGNKGECSLGTIGIVGATMLFYANDTGMSYGTLWRSDGTAEGMEQFTDVIVESCGV